MAKKKVIKSRSLILTERIENSILLVRGEKVMLDKDLAELYGVETKVFNQAVKRNIKRFPDDFMFQLTQKELETWRSQFVTSNPAAKMSLRRKPYAFTEQGVAMLSSVLHSDRAVEVNIEIMRAFVRIRKLTATHKDLASTLADVEKRLDKHDHHFHAVFETIRQLVEPPTQQQKDRRIGFRSDKQVGWRDLRRHEPTNRSQRT
jgi:hypothetical protein